MSESRLGYDHDHMEDVYRDIQGITLEDLKEFHRSRNGDHPFLYAIVGKVSDIDLDYLKSKGDVTFLSKEETFGF